MSALQIATENLLRTQPAAIAFLGSTGESAYLTTDEWQRAALLGVNIVAGRVPVILGISDLVTSVAVAKAKYAKHIGADMLMVIPVSYWKLSDQEIFDHYSAIAKATDLPIMAYNNPATSGVDMSPTLLLQMVNSIESVVSIKESSGDINRMHMIRTLSGGNVPFYNGANHLALEALAAGASGWCTAAPNLLDEQPATLCRLIAEDRLSEARELFYRLLPVLRFIVTGGLPTTIKAGLQLRGLNVGNPRAPLKPLAEEKRQELAAYLKALGVGPVARAEPA